MIIPDDNYIQEEIKVRIIAGNKCMISVGKRNKDPDKKASEENLRYLTKILKKNIWLNQGRGHTKIPNKIKKGT